MAGLARISVVVGFLLILTSDAPAFHGRFGIWHSSAWSSSYYVPAPYWYYCPPGPLVVPVPNAPRSTYAKPTPAPPSQTIEPPLQKMISDSRAPVLITTRSSERGVSTASDRCRVGFWNLSGRDVMLTIDGKAWSLPSNHMVTLETERQFAWHVDRQAQTLVRVTEGMATHEVVLRD